MSMAAGADIQELLMEAHDMTGAISFDVEPDRPSHRRQRRKYGADCTAIVSCRQRHRWTIRQRTH